MIRTILIMAVIGGFIGLFTNAVAIYLLFRPYEKVLFFQGMIPRRKAELAKSIGKVVESELINLEELVGQITDNLDLELIKDKLVMKIMEAVRNELPAIFPFSLIEKLLRKYLEREGDQLFLSMIGDFIEDGDNLTRISAHVEMKIMDYDLRKLEEIVLSVTKKELSFIVYLGGVLGLLIGVIQGLVVEFLLY